MTEPITLCELELPKEYKPGTIVEHFKRQHSLAQDEIKNKISNWLDKMISPEQSSDIKKTIVDTRLSCFWECVNNSV